MSKKSNNCHKCNQIIYEKDKFGPVNSNIYHKSCFKCLICDTSLTLKSYTTSQANINDKEVYCTSHAPKASQNQRTIKFDKLSDNTPKIKHTSSEECLLNAISKIEIDVKNNEINLNRRLSNALNAPNKTSNPNIPSFNEGKVTMLTRKWNSRESLLDSAQKPTTTNQNMTSKREPTNTQNEMETIKTQMTNLENSAEIIKSIPDLNNIFTGSQQTQEIPANRGINRQYTSSPKFIIDDLGGGISYTKYMEDIKRRQHNNSDQKRNITELYLKTSSASKKCGSTGDITLELSPRKNERQQVITVNNKIRLNVNDLISDELNFYKSFNNASKSLNKDLDRHDSRQNIMLSRDKLSNNNRYINCEEEILENMLVDESKIQTTDDNNTKIIVDFKTDSHNSNVLIQNSNNLLIRTLSRDNSRRNDSNYNFTKRSCEDLAETYYASPENILNKSLLQNQEIIRTTGSLMISYMFRNDEFFITIQKAKNLFKDKDEPLDTFVSMMILPDPRKQTTSTTSVAVDSINPEWNQTFVYGISYAAIKTKYIYVSIKDNKMALKLQSELSESLQHEALKLISLGECLMGLSDIRENVYYEMWCNLKEPSEVQNIIETKEL
jgi:hypothetical protein